MQYREYPPGELFQPFIECYWLYSTDGSADCNAVQRCLPLGTIEMIVQVNDRKCLISDNKRAYSLSDSIYFTGLYTRPAYWKAYPETLMFGIRFKPESLRSLFRIPASEIFNNVMDAELMLGKTGKLLKDELCGQNDIRQLISITEKHLSACLNVCGQQDHRVDAASRLIRQTAGMLTVVALSDKLCISKRQLERTFKDNIGTTPKTYQRIIRFRHVYGQIRARKGITADWTGMAYNCGYSDQAHLTREFKAFTGELPTALHEGPGIFFQTLEASSLQQA